MKKHCLVLLAFILFHSLSFGQKIGDYYVAIPSDSNSDCRLKFINDSTVELSNVPRHMGVRLTIIFKCAFTDTTIEIFSDKLSSTDSLSLKRFQIQYFINPKVVLTIVNKGLIDHSSSLIYVRQKDFDKNTNITYIIDGKTYIQDWGVTDGYGILRKSPKTNKKLQKRLDTIGQNPDKYSFEVLKGLKAYKRFGIKKVFGVIVITSKT